MKTRDLSQLEKNELLQFIDDLHVKLHQKKLNLQETRNKLNSARKRLTRLKEAVVYQQRRIIELSGRDNANQFELPAMDRN